MNSEMGTSLFHTCQYSPGCEWSLTWMYVGAWVWVEPYLDVCRSLPLGELRDGDLPVPHLPVLPLGVGGALPGCM